MVDGSCKFTVLPFGLSVVPFIFATIQKALMKHWIRQGIRLFTYLDDGAGGWILISVKHSGFPTWCDMMCIEVLWPMMQRASGCQSNPDSCWVMS